LATDVPQNRVNLVAVDVSEILNDRLKERDDLKLRLHQVEMDIERLTGADNSLNGNKFAAGNIGGAGLARNG